MTSSIQNQRNNNQNELQRLDLKSKNIEDSHNIFQELLNTCPNVIDLDISNNKLTFLPSNLSSFTELQRLDIKGNPFQKFDQIVSSLSNLPHLIELEIDVNTQQNVSLILQCLPNLQYLNGKKAKEEDSNRMDLDDNETTSISLDNEKPLFTEIYSTVSDQLYNLNKDISASFLKNFEELLKIEINKINKCVEMDSPNYLYATYVIESIVTILNYFNLSYYSYLDIKDKETSSLVKKINNHYHITTRKLIEIVYKLHPKIEEKFSVINKKNNILEKDSNENHSNNNNDVYLMEVKLKESETLIKQYQDEIKLWKVKVERLENENKMMTAKLFNNAKAIIHRNVQPLSNSLQEQRSIQMGNNSINSNSQSMIKKNRSVGILENNNNNINNQGSYAINSSSRVFTVKMMKDIIADLYNSKEDFNKMCDENRLPRETMEQHMYTHFNHKFGLKSIIIEWATNIINGIRAFSSENSEVCLFGKILRNELEEDSRQFLPLLKARINERLTLYLRAKYYLKSAGDINEIQKKMISGSLPEEEWKTVIYSLYEEADAKFLEKRLNDIIVAKNNINKSITEANNINRKMTREEIMILRQQKENTSLDYKDLIQVLHDFQIRSREKYLKHFVKLFKKVDQDNNGIINEEEFIELVSNFNLYSNENTKENINRLLHIIDPNNNKQITFSECITLFTMEVIEEQNQEKGTINILDKICLDNLDD